MPLISPPPIPSENFEPEGESSSRYSDRELWEHYCRRMIVMLNLPSWKCPKCGTVNHGLNRRCAYCWIRNKIVTEKINTP